MTAVTSQGNVDQAAALAPEQEQTDQTVRVEQWLTRPVWDLQLSAIRKRTEGLRLLAEGDEEAAVAEIRGPLDKLRAVADEAREAIGPARELVERAAAALPRYDEAIASARQSVEDLRSALAATDPANVHRVAAISERIAGYQEALRRAEAARVAPADQLAAAQAALRTAQELAAKAQAEVDARVKALDDPTHSEHAPQARMARLSRTYAVVLAQATLGQPVHPVDLDLARTMLRVAHQGLGLDDAIRRDERDRAWQQLGGPVVLPGVAPR